MYGDHLQQPGEWVGLTLQTVESPCNMATFIACTLEDYAVHGETLEWTTFINRDPYANFHLLINSFRLNGSYYMQLIANVIPSIWFRLQYLSI